MSPSILTWADMDMSPISLMLTLACESVAYSGKLISFICLIMPLFFIT